MNEQQTGQPAVSSEQARSAPANANSSGVKAFGLIGLVAVLIAGGIYMYRVAQPIEKTIRGKIVAMDVAARTGTFEIVHPKTGETFELAGSVPVECEIIIDGKPAKLADLKVGEDLEATGLLYRTGHVTAQKLIVTREFAGGIESTPVEDAQPAAGEDDAGD